VFPHLYLGSEKSLADSALEKDRITHILNATTNLAKPENISFENFMRVPVLDSMSEVILGFLNDCVDYIEQRRTQNQKVLVHCVAGISRSATITIG
jgi:protein-tyrosine phosphatase